MRKKALRGYAARDKITHKKYNFKASIRRYKKTGKFVYRGNGSGHKAGEEWANRKRIDPESRVTRYGKNSPSFDEGVYRSKQLRKALKSKME